MIEPDPAPIAATPDVGRTASEAPDPLPEVAVTLGDLHVTAVLTAPSHGGEHQIFRPKLEVVNHASRPRAFAVGRVLLYREDRAAPQRARVTAVELLGRTQPSFPVEVPPNETTVVVVHVDDVEGTHHVRFWYELQLEAGGEEATVRTADAYYRHPHPRR